MYKFGFSIDKKNAIPLVIETFENIDKYNSSTPYPLKKESLVFLEPPFSHWLFIADPEKSYHQFGVLPKQLPPDVFFIEKRKDQFDSHDIFLGWALGSYVFDQYKTTKNKNKPLLFLEDEKSISDILAIYITRDLINTPPNDMGPKEFVEYATYMLKDTTAVVQIHKADLKTWPSVYHVGKGSTREPLVLEIDWSPEVSNLSIGLAGKGICFDTGGYNLKTGTSMNLMKKDMGGAAQALALTKWIIDEKLPIKLKTIIPLAENSISGSAYRPSDVITSKKGITIEVGDTDAEGRIVLCDALYALCENKPDLVIDFATLTGAARIALGEIPALFSNNQNLAKDLLNIANKIHDPLWQLPLWEPYKKNIKGKVADISNIGSSPYAGAITAALFLNEFIPDDIPWAHIDFMAWNLQNSPARPEGAEAMGLRSVFEYLKQKAHNELR